MKFERLQNLSTFTHNEFLANAVHKKDHPLHDDFIEIV
jgi:hypothetical protein